MNLGLSSSSDSRLIMKMGKRYPYEDIPALCELGWHKWGNWQLSYDWDSNEILGRNHRYCLRCFARQSHFEYLTRKYFGKVATRNVDS